MDPKNSPLLGVIPMACIALYSAWHFLRRGPFFDGFPPWIQVVAFIGMPAVLVIWGSVLVIRQSRRG